jgi:hypothetical protein
MIVKGVKPRTHLMIDLLLFALLGLVAFSAIMEHSASPDAAHIRSIFHLIHGMTGSVMCLTLVLHLYMHLPWIWGQLTRLFKSRA